MAKRNATTIETLVRRDLPKQLRQARTRTEKLVNRTWKQALDLLPTGPRKRVKTAVARVDKAAANLQRRVDKAATNLQKRSERALKNARKRSENLVDRVETRAVEVAKPIVKRLDIASRHDVERLSRRVAQLERRVSRKPKTRQHAAAA
jgi:hypothetical protein